MQLANELAAATAGRHNLSLLTYGNHTQYAMLTSGNHRGGGSVLRAKSHRASGIDANAYIDSVARREHSSTDTTCASFGRKAVVDSQPV